MFVLTVDQVDSRRRQDEVAATIRDLSTRYGERLAVDPERTAGDEFQLLVTSGPAALDIALDLVRSEAWSVGLGAGQVREPRGTSVRAMSGSAFVNAREAVTTAKKRAARFAFVGGGQTPGLDPLIRLLLALRERRTPEGWELFDVLESTPAPTLTDAAEQLGISVQAASQRALTAGLRLDREARDTLGSMLDAEGGRIEE